MTRVGVQIGRPAWRELREFLFAGWVEAGAFLVADWEPSRQVMVVEQILLPDSAAVDLATPHHLALSDDFVGGAIATAWQQRRCLIESHCHVGDGPAAFSFSDLAGLKELVPHVRWRMQRAPYAAMVLTRTGFAGLVWVRAGATPDPLHYIEIGGEIIAADTRERHGEFFAGA